MMVEVLSASAAPSAMLCVYEHVSITKLAEQIELILWETLLRHSLESLSANKRVTWICTCGFDRIPNYNDIERDQNSSDSNFLTLEHDALHLREHGHDDEGFDKQIEYKNYPSEDLVACKRTHEAVTVLILHDSLPIFLYFHCFFKWNYLFLLQSHRVGIMRNTAGLLG